MVNLISYLFRHFLLWVIMRTSRLLVSTSTAIVLMAAALIVILFDTNLTTIANAQQQQPSNQTAATENSTLFQSTTDNFRVQVPEGWIIQDIDNTGATLEAEVLEGYGVLAQLCPQDQQQAVPNAVANNSTGSLCQGSEGDIVHILRYPDLGAGVGFASDDTNSDFDDAANTILSYQIQKLQEHGYIDIQIVNSTDTTYTTDISTAASDVNDDNIDALPSSIEAPARLVEMTYNTSFAPNEMRRGYYLFTATEATSPSIETLIGYGIFYEGNSTASAAAADDTITTTPSSDGLVSTTLPAPVMLVFDSFELIASEETIQALLATLAAQAEQSGQVQQTETDESISPLAGQFFSSSSEGIAPATIEFAAVISGGSGPYTINWDFGDGSEGESDNDEDIAHTFEEAGTYTVTVIATDSAGQVVSGSLEITVEEAPAEEVEEQPTTAEEEVEPDLDDVDNDTDSEDSGLNNPIFDDDTDSEDSGLNNPIFDDDTDSEDSGLNNPIFDDDTDS
jgi:PKD repeat protein